MCKEWYGNEANKLLVEFPGLEKVEPHNCKTPKDYGKPTATDEIVDAPDEKESQSEESTENSADTADEDFGSDDKINELTPSEAGSTGSTIADRR